MDMLKEQGTEEPYPDPEGGKYLSISDYRGENWK